MARDLLSRPPSEEIDTLDPYALDRWADDGGAILPPPATSLPEELVPSFEDLLRSGHIPGVQVLAEIRTDQQVQPGFTNVPPT
jgi:hypothetical protein